MRSAAQVREYGDELFHLPANEIFQEEIENLVFRAASDQHSFSVSFIAEECSLEATALCFRQPGALQWRIRSVSDGASPLGLRRW